MGHQHRAIAVFAMHDQLFELAISVELAGRRGKDRGGACDHFGQHVGKCRFHQIRKGLRRVEKRSQLPRETVTLAMPPQQYLPEKLPTICQDAVKLLGALGEGLGDVLQARGALAPAASLVVEHLVVDTGILVSISYQRSERLGTVVCLFLGVPDTVEEADQIAHRRAIGTWSRSHIVEEIRSAGFMVKVGVVEHAVSRHAVEANDARHSGDPRRSDVHARTRLEAFAQIVCPESATKQVVVSAIDQALRWNGVSRRGVDLPLIVRRAKLDEFRLAWVVVRWNLVEIPRLDLGEFSIAHPADIAQLVLRTGIGSQQEEAKTERKPAAAAQTVHLPSPDHAVLAPRRECIQRHCTKMQRYVNLRDLETGFICRSAQARARTRRNGVT